MKKNDLEHLAALAKLSFSPEELSRLEREMEEIMIFVSNLPSDTQNDNFVLASMPEACREDIPNPFDNRKEILAGAPAVDDGCIAVPKVVED